MLIFTGAHKHVFLEEANLNADNDKFFNDKTSSFVIVQGFWWFSPDWNFKDPKLWPLGNQPLLLGGELRDTKQFHSFLVVDETLIQLCDPEPKRRRRVVNAPAVAVSLFAATDYP